MENQIYKWNQLNKKDKYLFVNFVVNKIIIGDFKDDIQILIFYLFLKFLQFKNWIATIFDFDVFEVEMIKNCKFVRLKLKDDENLEYIGYCYDFIPFIEIKIFIDTIRKKKLETLHYFRIDPQNANTSDLEFQIIQLKYNDLTIPYYYNNEDFIKSFVKNFLIKKLPIAIADFFKYDYKHVPEIPNICFLNEFFESMDVIVLHKKYLVLFLNHLQNLIEDQYLTIGIMCKMIIYKLTDEPLKYKLKIEKANATENGFIEFLIAKALNKKPNLQSLKKYLISQKEINQSTLYCISNLL